MNSIRGEYKYRYNYDSQYDSGVESHSEDEELIQKIVSHKVNNHSKIAWFSSVKGKGNPAICCEVDEDGKVIFGTIEGYS